MVVDDATRLARHRAALRAAPWRERRLGVLGLRFPLRRIGEHLTAYDAAPPGVLEVIHGLAMATGRWMCHAPRPLDGIGVAGNGAGGRPRSFFDDCRARWALGRIV